MVTVPIIRTILSAFAFVLSRCGECCRIALPAVLFIAVIDVVVLSIDAVDEVGTGIGIAAGLLALVMSALFAVGWHRVCLYSSETLVRADVYCLGKRQRRYFRLLIEFLLLYLVLFSAFYFVFIVGLPQLMRFMPGSTAVMLFPSAMTMLAVALCARFSIAFAAAADDSDIALTKSWELSHGNGWRIFWILVAVVTVFTIVNTAVSQVVGLLPPTSGVFAPAIDFLGAVILNAVNFFAIAVGVSAVSSVYSEFRQAGLFDQADEASS